MVPPSLAASLALARLPGQQAALGLRAEEEGAAWGSGQSWVTAQPEGERLEKPADPTGGLVIDLHIPSGREAGSKSRRRSLWL